MRKTIFMLLTIVAIAGQAQEQVARGGKLRVKVGNWESAEAQTLEELGISELPKYRALIIGVSEYTNASAGLRNLAEPVNDAQKLYDVLTTYYTFEPDNVMLLKNPTRAQILEHLQTLADVTTNEENVLIFYAGHGIFDAKLDAGYWIAADGVEGKKPTYLANTELRTYLNAIDSKHTLLISDACFGGSIFTAGRSSYSGTEIAKFNEIYKIKSRKALTSGNFQEVPDESIFMKYVLKTLSENVSPVITATLLNAKIFDPINSNSRILPQYGAIRDAGDEGPGGSFIFIRRKLN